MVSWGRNEEHLEEENEESEDEDNEKSEEQGAEEREVAVGGPLRLQADSSQVRFANITVRP